MDLCQFLHGHPGFLLDNSPVAANGLIPPVLWVLLGRVHLPFVQGHVVGVITRLCCVSPAGNITISLRCFFAVNLESVARVSIIIIKAGLGSHIIRHPRVRPIRLVGGALVVAV